MKMLLSDKIKQLRKNKGWSQTELAKHLGVHTNHVSRLESGRYQPSIDLLKKLAKILEVSADYLLNDEEDNLSSISIEDKSLSEKLQLINALDAQERDSLINIINALITKKKVFDAVMKEAHPII